MRRQKSPQVFAGRRSLKFRHWSIACFEAPDAEANRRRAEFWIAFAFASDSEFAFPRFRIRELMNRDGTRLVDALRMLQSSDSQLRHGRGNVRYASGTTES